MKAELLSWDVWPTRHAIIGHDVGRLEQGTKLANRLRRNNRPIIQKSPLRLRYSTQEAFDLDTLLSILDTEAAVNSWTETCSLG